MQIKNKKSISCIVVTVVALVLFSAGFIETCVEYDGLVPQLCGPEYDSVCPVFPPTCTSFWSSIMQNEPVKNTKPINGTQAVIDHPTFKKVGGMPSTLIFTTGNSEDTLPPKTVFIGCFKTETDEIYSVAYIVRGESPFDDRGIIYYEPIINPMSSKLEHYPKC